MKKCVLQRTHQLGSSWVGPRCNSLVQMTSPMRYGSDCLRALASFSYSGRKTGNVLSRYNTQSMLYTFCFLSAAAQQRTYVVFSAASQQSYARADAWSQKKQEEKKKKQLVRDFSFCQKCGDIVLTRLMTSCVTREPAVGQSSTISTISITQTSPVPV